MKQLYYRTTKKFVVSQDTLFNVGEKCDEIYIILSGVFDIEITNGVNLSITLDLLGKGSIIGSNYILK
jgi:CRP-like cAMP-binding protein